MTRTPNRCPTHPGAILREDILPAVKCSKTVIADGLSMTRQNLHRILTEKCPVTPEVAVKLAKMFGGSSLSWINMQSAFDAWNAERSVDVSSIPVLTAAE